MYIVQVYIYIIIYTYMGRVARLKEVYCSQIIKKLSWKRTRLFETFMVIQQVRKSLTTK